MLLVVVLVLAVMNKICMYQAGLPLPSGVSDRSHGHMVKHDASLVCSILSFGNPHLIPFHCIHKHGNTKCKLQGTHTHTHTHTHTLLVQAPEALRCVFYPGEVSDISPPSPPHPITSHSHTSLCSTMMTRLTSGASEPSSTKSLSDNVDFML